jgi:hypothetical protein
LAGRLHATFPDVRLRDSVYAAGALGIAVLFGWSSARAFCRTTTVPQPIGFNPAASGSCWTLGKPIAWTAGRVPYGISSAASKYVTFSEAERVADLAFAQWNSALCVGGQPSVQAYDVGPLEVTPGSGDCTTSSTCDAPTQNVIVFRDQMWPHDDPANVLALTTVTYGVHDGEILEAYTEVNSAHHVLTTLEPPPRGMFDLQAILTHEAGHFLGLAHATDTHPIMYAYYQAGAINLTPDDVGAICTAYQPAPSGGSCQSAPAGPGLFGTVSGLSLAILAVARRRRSWVK